MIAKLTSNKRGPIVGLCVSFSGLAIVYLLPLLSRSSLTRLSVPVQSIASLLKDSSQTTTLKSAHSTNNRIHRGGAKGGKRVAENCARRFCIQRQLERRGQSVSVRNSAAYREIHIHVLWVVVRQAVSANTSRLSTAETQVLSHVGYWRMIDRLTRPWRRTVTGKIRIQYCDVTSLLSIIKPLRYRSTAHSGDTARDSITIHTTTTSGSRCVVQELLRSFLHDTYTLCFPVTDCQQFERTNIK